MCPTAGSTRAPAPLPFRIQAATWGPWWRPCMPDRRAGGRRFCQGGEAGLRSAGSPAARLGDRHENPGRCSRKESYAHLES
eukprot:785992-Heterocapsa_arctica.AAC.1